MRCFWKRIPWLCAHLGPEPHPSLLLATLPQCMVPPRCFVAFRVPWRASPVHCRIDDMFVRLRRRHCVPQRYLAQGVFFMQVIHDIGNVFRVAVPMLLYFSVMWTGTFLGCRRAGMHYADAVVQVQKLCCSWSMVCGQGWCR